MTDHKLRGLKALAQALMDSIDDLIDSPVPAQSAPGEKRVIVPWIGQNVDTVTTDDYTKSDCGAACVAMLIAYRGRSVTVDEVSIATGRPRGYTLVSFDLLITAASRFNLVLTYVSGLTVAQMCADIDAGKPTICLINYKGLPTYNRYDANYNAGHYIVVTGYDTDCILYHDPYWPEATRGSYRALTREDFARAYATVAPGNTRALHALRLA